MKATGHVTRRRARARPGRVPRTPTRTPRAGLARVPAARAARSTCATTATGGPTCRAPAGSRPEGPGSDTYTRARHPVTHVAYEDAEAYAAWAGQGAADRGRVGVRRARRPRGRHVRVGRRGVPRRSRDGQHVAGRVPVAEPRLDGYDGHVAGRRVPAQRLRAFDMTGNVWEWTVRPLRATRRAAAPVLRPAAAGDGLERRGDQGRLAPVRAELLPALPARRAAGRGDRHVDDATSASAASCGPGRAERLSARTLPRAV